jgi:hypothetical protein
MENKMVEYLYPKKHIAFGELEVGVNRDMLISVEIHCTLTHGSENWVKG